MRTIRHDTYLRGVIDGWSNMLPFGNQTIRTVHDNMMVVDVHAKTSEAISEHGKSMAHLMSIVEGNEMLEMEHFTRVDKVGDYYVYRTVIFEEVT